MEAEGGQIPSVVSELRASSAVEAGGQVADQARETVNALPARERAGRAIGAAVKLVADRFSEGLLDDKGEEIREAAQASQLYQAGEVTPETSNGLRGLMTVLKAGDDETSRDLAARISQGYLVKIREGENEQFLTREQWEAEMARTDLSDADREKLANGLHGHSFPSENQQAAQAEEAKPPLTEDVVIATQISTLERQIAEAKARGEDTGRKEGILVTLRLASQANGEVGVLLKVKALQDLKASGVAGLDDSLQALGERVPAAQQKLIEYLSVQGVSESDIIAACGLGGRSGLDRLITQGILDKVEGLDELVFGKELTKEDLGDLLDTTDLILQEKQDLLKKYGKKAGFGLLLLILSTTFGAVDFGKQVAK